MINEKEWNNSAKVRRSSYEQKTDSTTMLLFHWWLYVLDDMIKAECKQHQKENSKGEDEKKNLQILCGTTYL